MKRRKKGHKKTTRATRLILEEINGVNYENYERSHKESIVTGSQRAREGNLSEASDETRTNKKTYEDCQADRGLL